MTDKATIRAEAARLLDVFRDAGATARDPDILIPSDVLLDLYGEDIRARAYVTSDPLQGEQMLRPDFTVPVVQSHLAAGGGAARYAYSGEVFRRQEDDPARAREYIQVGFEVFGGDPAAAEAEAFAVHARAVGGVSVRMTIGDIGLLVAAIDGLAASDRRKAALKRHLWRPARFRRLLARYSAPRTVPEALKTDAPHVGLRSAEEIAERLAALEEDARHDSIPGSEAERLEALLSLRAPAHEALEQLKTLAEPAALARFDQRLQALSAAGVDVESLMFEGSYGRTSLEYYDGFVFGFSVVGRDDLPPVVTGGRYDALVRVLGGSDGAVGGVVRPAVMVEAQA